MTVRSSLMYAKRLMFSGNSTRRTSSNGRRSLLGATLCIGISLVPLVAILIISEGMIQGMTGRLIHLSSHDISVHLDSSSASAQSASAMQEAAAKILKLETITGAFPEVRGSSLAAAGGYRTGASVRAVEPDIFVKNESFSSLLKVVEGKADLDSPRNAVIGQKIAELLGVHPGDRISLITAGGSARPVPKVAQFTVTGIVSCGYQELDALWVFIPLEAGFTSLARNSVSFVIGLTTQNPFSKDFVFIARDVQKFLFVEDGIEGAYVSRWDEENAAQYENFSSTKSLVLLIMLLIVLVASINISSALVMVQMERRKEIAILKSVGASSGGITLSFLAAGMFSGAAGLVLGIPAGLLVGVNVNSIIHAAESVANFFLRLKLALFSPENAGATVNVHILDPAFYLQEIPVEVPAEGILAIVLGTLVLVFAVSAVPAIWAGREKPLDTLRKV